MKYIKKIEIKFIFLAIIIITALTMGVVNAAYYNWSDSYEYGLGDLHWNDPAGAAYLQAGTPMYCIQYEQQLSHNRSTYRLGHKIVIDGKKATVYGSENDSGRTVVSEYNARLAYIFNKKQGYGPDEPKFGGYYTEAQRAIWAYMNEWTQELFKNRTNPYNWAYNDSISDSGNSVAAEAKEYANSIGDLTSDSAGQTLNVTDVTNRDKVKKEKVNDDYYRFGPFKWEFEGELTSIVVKANEARVNDVKFVQNANGGKKYVDVKEIGTGKKFFIDIKDGEDIDSIHLKLKTKAKEQSGKVIKATVWLFRGNTQNLARAKTELEPIPRDGEGEQDYTVNGDRAARVGLIKVDDRGDETALEGVGFKFRAQVKRLVWTGSTQISRPCTCSPDADGNIHCSGHGTWTKNFYDWETYTMYVDSNDMWNPVGEGSAQEFKTDIKGNIPEHSVAFNSTHVTNRTEEGESYYVYDNYEDNPNIVAIESSNPHYGYEPEIGKEYSLNSMNETKTLLNHQKYVKLSGYVWLEQHQGKTTLNNDIYDNGIENGVNGIKVYLKDSNGNIVINNKGEQLVKETGEKGLYNEIEGGEYLFEGVDLDELQAGKYHVEFEYGGIKYQSVAANLNKTNGSKAIDTNSRNILDSKFTSVDGNGTQSLNINGVKANYNGTNQHASTVNNYEGDKVWAKTDEAGYHLYSDFEPTMEEIRYVNLGLFEKEQVDYALTKDLYNVRVEVNGKSHIYRYATVRYNNGNVDENSSWNVGVKFQRNTGTYSRAIYRADGEFTSSNRDRELKVFATYKIALKNESPYLGRINNIVDYCDSRMKMIHVGTTINEQDVISNELGREQVAYNSDKYSKYRINTNAVINPRETHFIYVQFEMDRNAVLSLINNGELLNNLVEINSYTTFKNNNVNTPVAVVDKDSVPGNMILGQINTYEDDTDAATSLKLELKNARAITGTVFVDKTGKEGQEAVAEQERRGNGIFDNGETVLSDVEVKLVDKETNQITKMYDESLNTFVDAITVTNGNGEFKFVGFIPGDYEVVYTWGNETYKVQYYKGTIYNKDRVNKYNQTRDTFWYRGSEYGNDTIGALERYTDAFDNTQTRANIEDEMRKITINTLESEINKAYEGGSSEIIKTTKMDSITPKIEISVEYPTTITDGTVEQVRFALQNIDFGIVERAKQALDFRKRISGYKITLANGQVLVDIEIDENGKVKGEHKYTTYLKPTVQSGIINIGQLKTEMDNELIEGATLETIYEMKVTNVGELDYSTKDYYYYGIQGNDSEKVTASVTELLDYVDGRLNVVKQEDSNNRWTEIEKEYLYDVNASKKGAENINKYRIYLTSSLTKALKPGESNSVTLSTSKLLTSTEDNTFNNEAEISQVEKNRTGFTIGTPVKLINSYFNIGASEEIVVIPPTGKNNSIVLPTIVGITAIVILGVGIILIKKFVIDKK